MDARTIRTLMDINALQSLGSVRSLSEQSSTSSMFNKMLEEMLAGTPISNSLSSASANMLGTNTSMENLLYKGSNPVFFPHMLETVQTPAHSLASTQTKPLPSGSGQYTEIINQAAEKYNLPAKLISSVIKQESNFNNNVVSHAGAEGLMQLMPGTAKFLGVTDSFNPKQNITGGAKYLRQMLNQFNGNMELALAAYNAGPGNVKKYGGIPPFKETQQYVKKVLNSFNS
ncbi:lytic transglycosylase domain-containing protein [Sporosarcina sp. CAU 1771]